MLVAVFCLFFTSQEINTKWSPNAAKLFGDFFGPEDIQETWSGRQEAAEVATRVQGTPPTIMGPLWLP